MNKQNEQKCEGCRRLARSFPGGASGYCMAGAGYVDTDGSCKIEANRFPPPPPISKGKELPEQKFNLNQ